MRQFEIQSLQEENFHACWRKKKMRGLSSEVDGMIFDTVGKVAGTSDRCISRRKFGSGARFTGHR